MKAKIVFSGLFAASMLGAQVAMADCSSDIDAVEGALYSPDTDYDESTSNEMRRLLEEANEQRKKGDEAKCQELINQAKAMGNVE